MEAPKKEENDRYDDERWYGMIILSDFKLNVQNNYSTVI